MPTLTENLRSFVRNFPRPWRAAPPEGKRLPVGRGGAYAGAGWNWLGRRYGRTNYEHEAGNVLHNSAVAACLNWLTTSFPAAPYVLIPERDQDGEEGAGENLAEHPVLDLLRQPAPNMSGRRLAAALLRDLYGPGRGNAYCYIVVVDGEPVELQYLPPGSIRPVGNDDETLTHYEFTARKGYEISPGRVLHFRFGVSEENPALGVWPLESVLPEIAVDRKATDWQWNLMAEGGVPAGVLGPKGTEGGVTASWTQQEMDHTEAQLREKQPGSVLLLGAGFDYKPMGFAPKDMATGEVQRKSEERIAAVFNIPPVVANLGAGLDRSTFNNYEEARQAAWEDGIIPLQDTVFADELNAKLKPLYQGRDSLDGWLIGFDRSGIRALADDKTAEAGRRKTQAEAAQVLIQAGFEPAASLEAVGLPALPFEEPEPLALPAPAPENVPPAADSRSARRRRRATPATRERSSMDTALDAYRAALARREGQAVKVLAGTLRAAEAAAAEAIEALAVRLEKAEADGENVNLAWLERQAEYRALLAGLEEALSALEDDGDALTAVTTRAAEDGEDRAEAVYRAALGPVPAGATGDAVDSALTFRRVPQDALEAIAAFASDGTPLGELLAEVGPECVQQVREALAVGIALGRNPRQTAATLQGILGSTRARAEAIARTETLRAMREATRRSYLANSDVVSAYRRLSAADSRTCAACWALHGKTYPTNQPLPVHVNDRCALVPVTKSWAEITGDASLPDTRPAIESGAAQFARLSEEAQRSILGPGGYELYAAGKPLSAFAQEVSDPRWGATIRVSTLAEVEASV